MATLPSAAASASGELVGRARECELVERLLAEAWTGRSRTLVVRGEPGIGKSAVLEHAARSGAAHTVLRCRGIESESELAFSGLFELLRPLLGRLRDLPEPQRAALEGVLALAASIGADRFAAYVAALSLLSAGSREGPLLVIVDDAHWLDGASAEAITFVARRLRAEPIALLAAVREDEPSTFAADGFDVLALGRLDDAAAEALVERAAPELSRVRIHELVRAAGGNPLALRELASSARSLRSADGGPEPLRPGPAIEQAFLRRVRRLPAATQSALVVASAAGSDSARTVLAALASLGVDAAALDDAEADRLVELRDDRVLFDHPLVRSAVYHAATPAERRRVHRALAEAAAADGDADAAAWHRAAATTTADEAVAAALEQAAQRARDRAAHAPAARALERSARLSPAAETRARRLYEAAVEFAAVGRSEHALELLDEAVELVSDPLVRADAQHLRGRLLISTGGSGAGDLLLAEGLRVSEHDPARGAVMIVGSVGAFIWAVQQERVREAVEHAMRLPSKPDGLAELFLDDGLAWVRVFEGDLAEARHIAVRAATRLERDRGLRNEPRIGGFVGQLLYVVEEYDRARSVLTTIVGEARAATALPSLAYALVSLGIVETRAGRWVDAAAALHEAVDLTSLAGSKSDHAWALEMLARLEAGVGEEVECRRHAEAALAIADEHRLASHTFVARSALGLLALGTGRYADAVADLRAGLAVVGRRARGDATFQPYLTPDLVEAQLRSGAPEAAEEALRRFEHDVEQTDVASARAAALRCRGLLAADAEFDALFERALAAHDEAPSVNPFERARTRLCYGERLRRARRRGDARRELEAALDAFDSLGARPWSEHAHAELALAGRAVRGRRPPGFEALLTAQELQVALVVGRGATNREAAAALFLSTKTIENHLTHIFEKLGLRSRAELARVVALHENGRPPVPSVPEQR